MNQWILESIGVRGEIACRVYWTFDLLTKAGHVAVHSPLLFRKLFSYTSALFSHDLIQHWPTPFSFPLATFLVTLFADLCRTCRTWSASQRILRKTIACVTLSLHRFYSNSLLLTFFHFYRQIITYSQRNLSSNWWHFTVPRNVLVRRTTSFRYIVVMIL